MTAFVPTKSPFVILMPPDVTIAPIEDPEASIVLELEKVPDVFILPDVKVPFTTVFAVTDRLTPTNKLFETARPPAKLPLPLPIPVDSVTFEFVKIPDIVRLLFIIVVPVTVSPPPILHDFSIPIPPAVLIDPLEVRVLSVVSEIDNLEASDEFPVPEQTNTPELVKLVVIVRLPPVKIFLAIYTPPEICRAPVLEPDESIVEVETIFPVVIIEVAVTPPEKVVDPVITAFPPI
jgi:hypothetical protein